MLATCTFSVASFEAVDYSPEVTTAVGTGHAHMVKEYVGAITGRSITQFSYCYDDASGIGTYVATESFEGTVDEHSGTFNFVHSATDLGDGRRTNELFVIVPGSGTGDLAALRGTGAMIVDGQTHRLELVYEV